MSMSRLYYVWYDNTRVNSILAEKTIGELNRMVSAKMFWAVVPIIWRILILKKT